MSGQTVDTACSALGVPVETAAYSVVKVRSRRRCQHIRLEPLEKEDQKYSFFKQLSCQNANQLIAPAIGKRARPRCPSRFQTLR